jgi:hypothetical protein
MGAPDSLFLKVTIYKQGLLLCFFVVWYFFILYSGYHILCDLFYTFYVVLKV